MLNPISQRKGWGRKSEKKEKEEMERKKEKEKNENQEKNKRKERRIPDQRARGSKKKRSNSRSMKKEDRKPPKARLPLRIILDWQYPTPQEQKKGNINMVVQEEHRRAHKSTNFGLRL